MELFNLWSYKLISDILPHILGTFLLNVFSFNDSWEWAVSNIQIQSHLEPTELVNEMEQAIFSQEVWSEIYS